MIKIEDQNCKMKKKTQELHVLTANLELSHHVNSKYIEVFEAEAEKENKAETPPPPVTQKRVEKKEKASWECPVIEFIEESDFDKLNRHQKGSLKYPQLKAATSEVRTAFGFQEVSLRLAGRYIEKSLL